MTKQPTKSTDPSGMLLDSSDLTEFQIVAMRVAHSTSFIAGWTIAAYPDDDDVKIVVSCSDLSYSVRIEDRPDFTEADYVGASRFWIEKAIKRLFDMIVEASLSDGCGLVDQPIAEE